MEWTFPKMTTLGVIGLQLWKSGSMSLRFKIQGQSPDLETPIENLWDLLEKALSSNLTPTMINARSWWKMNATLDGDKYFGITEATWS